MVATVLGLMTAVGSCATPVVSLARAFREISVLPPRGQGAGARRAHRRGTPLTLLAPAGPFVAYGALSRFFRTRRALRVSGSP